MQFQALVQCSKLPEAAPEAARNRPASSSGAGPQFDQRLTHSDKRVPGAANRLQQFATVCGGLLRGLPGGA
eukprot:9940606-Alexandrium_andersonii.AAC.1